MPTPDDIDISKDPEADFEAETDGADTIDTADDTARKIDADPAFSPAGAQAGAALSNLGARRGSDLFRKD